MAATADDDVPQTPAAYGLLHVAKVVLALV